MKFFSFKFYLVVCLRLVFVGEDVLCNVGMVVTDIGVILCTGFRVSGYIVSVRGTKRNVGGIFRGWGSVGVMRERE